jgi:hypothetical protein
LTSQTLHILKKQSLQCNTDKCVYYRCAVHNNLNTANNINILKAGIVQPEKQPLLANGSETTFISRQRIDKHVPAATDTHAKIEVLLETVFSTRSMQRSYKEDNWGNRLGSLKSETVKYGRESQGTGKGQQHI